MNKLPRRGERKSSRGRGLDALTALGCWLGSRALAVAGRPKTAAATMADDLKISASLYHARVAVQLERGQAFRIAGVFGPIRHEQIVAQIGWSFSRAGGRVYFCPIWRSR